jgi:hypothetical protein
MKELNSLRCQPTSFFKLSQELRDQIYGHVFQTDEEPVTEPSQLNNLTKIFALDKQIYSETYNLFYSKFYPKLVFTFTSIERLLSMVRSIGWHHPGFTGRLQLHHIYDPLSFIDPAPLSVYDKSNAIGHIIRHFGVGIWRPNSDDGDGGREKFKDNPFVVDIGHFFKKGTAGDLDSIEAEVMTGGGNGLPASTKLFGRSEWNSGPNWTVSVKYAYLEYEVRRGGYAGEALEVYGDLRTSMRTLFSTPSLSKRRA